MIEGIAQRKADGLMEIPPVADRGLPPPAAGRSGDHAGRGAAALLRRGRCDICQSIRQPARRAHQQAVGAVGAAVRPAPGRAHRAGRLHHAGPDLRGRRARRRRRGRHQPAARRLCRAAGALQPYAPSSRIFHNALYADPAAVFGQEAVDQGIAALNIGHRLAAAEARDEIDWPTLSVARHALLRWLWDHHDTLLGADAQQAFAAFRARGGSGLLAHACFEAIQASLLAQAGDGADDADDARRQAAADWRQWPVNAALARQRGGGRLRNPISAGDRLSRLPAMAGGARAGERPAPRARRRHGRGTDRRSGRGHRPRWQPRVDASDRDPQRLPRRRAAGRLQPARAGLGRGGVLAARAAPQRLRRLYRDAAPTSPMPAGCASTTCWGWRGCGWCRPARRPRRAPT